MAGITVDISRGIDVNIISFDFNIIRQKNHISCSYHCDHKKSVRFADTIYNKLKESCEYDEKDAQKTKTSSDANFSPFTSSS